MRRLEGGEASSRPRMNGIRSIRVSGRIEDDLPYLLSMMTAMSKAGMDLTDILSALRAEETFGEPTRRLLSSVALESMSRPLSVVLNEKSKFFGARIRSFLSGLAVETVKGDVSHYLESFTSKLMEEKLGEIRGTASLEEILSIAYSTLFVMGPMVAIVVLSALGYLSAPLLSLENWFSLLFLFYVPAGTFFFTIAGWRRGPVKRAIPFILVSVILISTGLLLEYGLLSDILVSASGLIFLPLGLYESRSWLREQSIDRHLTTFLSDFSLQLLSGRDFLQSFRSLVGKRYGRLSQILQKMVNAMELGAPFTETAPLLSHETVFSKRIVTLLTTFMRKGGETSRIMERVSGFSWRLHQIEVEKRRRQYFTVAFFYIFMAVFLFLATSTLQIFSIAVPILGGIPATPAISKVLFNASMISAVCTGLVAGAVTTKRLGAGGIHVFSFTVMSIFFYCCVW